MDASLSGPRGLYAPLPTATSIRVIELHPLQSDNAPINCTLHLTNLERETLDFQALSYTWGDPLYRYWFDREKHTTWVRDVPIVCNGVSVDVTVNFWFLRCVHETMPSNKAFFSSDQNFFFHDRGVLLYWNTRFHLFCLFFSPLPCWINISSS